MPANLAVPAGAGNYNVTNIIPILFPDEIIQEGKKVIPLSISWGGSEVANGATRVDLAGKQSDFSLIRSMYIDNFLNGADVTVMFPDTGFQFVVPAGAADHFLVVSKMLSFYVVSPMAIGTDKTFIQAYNFIVPPLSVYKSVFMSSAVAQGVVLTANSTTPLFSNPGTITYLSLHCSAVLGGAGAGGATIFLRDHVTGANVGAGTVNAANAQQQAAGAQPILTMDGINIRAQGLDMVVNTFGTVLAAGAITANVAFRTP